MTFPSEEEIEAIVSEMQCHADKEHAAGQECDLCAFSNYLNHLTDLKGRITVIDTYTQSFLCQMMAAPVILATGDTDKLMDLARLMFVVGFKAGRNQATKEFSAFTL